MDVLVCEDDPVARSVISDLVEEHGGRVLAAVDSAIDALAFLERFTPDVVILDLMLRYGSGGIQILEHLRREHPEVQVVIFTAYDSMVPSHDDAVEVVLKPDFERLTRILTSSGERTGERRRPVRSVSADPTTVNSHDFYRLVAEAAPDDVLLCVRFDDPADADRVAEDLHGFLRGHDFVLPRSDSVVALLVGGGDDTVAALELRLHAQLPHLADHAVTATVGADPTDTFTRLMTG